MAKPIDEWIIVRDFSAAQLEYLAIERDWTHDRSQAARFTEELAGMLVREMRATDFPKAEMTHAD